MVVTEKDMGMHDALAVDRLAVIAGNDQPALARTARELNTDSWTSGVPTPLGLFDVGSKIPRLRPGTALVGAGCDEYVFVVAAEWQPDCPRFLIDDGTGIADRDRIVAAVFVNQLLWFPALPAIAAAAHDEVDIAVVGAPCLATFAEGEQRPLRRPN